MTGARRLLSLAEGNGLGTRTDCPGVSFGRDFDQDDWRRNYVQRLFPGHRSTSNEGMCGAWGRREEKKWQSGHVPGPGWGDILYDGVGRKWVSFFFQEAALADVDGFFLHECGWLFADALSNAYLYKFPRGRHRARRTAAENGLVAGKAAHKGKAFEHMTTNCRPGKIYLAF